MTTTTPELTIAVVLHNSAATLAVCLRSVQGSIEAGWAELIAVDNDSPDESAAVLRRELPKAALLSLDENRGFASGANAALARARGRYWMLLNPDVHAPQGGLEELIRWMDNHPRVGIASPELVGTDGGWEAPGRSQPSAARILLELTRLHRALPRRLRSRVLRGSYWTGGDQFDAGWVPGTAMIVRPQAMREAGPLRADMFMYGEDLEWCWRVRRAGWRIGVCSATTFIHDASSSAHRTFGEAETARRCAAGIDAACRSIYGPRRARILSALMALALLAEAAAPGRTSPHRYRAHRAGCIWWQLARCKR